MSRAEHLKQAIVAEKITEKKNESNTMKRTKRFKLSSETVEQLQAQKRENETMDDVIQRFVPDVERLSTEQLAYEAMLADDEIKRGEEQLSPRSYIKKEYGVDPADYNDKREFVRAVNEARNKRR